MLNQKNPRVDFYILPDGQASSRLTFACRLIEKAYKNRHRVYVHAENAADAYAIDELLWTYREESFLPHNLYGEGPETTPPIQIGFNVTPEKQRDILLNLHRDIPPFYKQFNRVLEIVSDEPAIQTAGRERYRLYRAEGSTINTHKLQSIEL